MIIRLFFKKILSKFFLINSYCKNCGVDIVDFYLPDETWNNIMGIESDKTFCFNCFARKSNKIWALIDIEKIKN